VQVKPFFYWVFMSSKATPSLLFLLEKFTYCEKTGILKYRKNSGRFSAGDIAGYTNHRGYRKVCVNGSHFFIHRIVWKMVYGVDPNGEIDHINRDKTDNRISNLRDVTSEENQKNRKFSSESGVSGVYFNKPRNRWQARIQLHLGFFKTIEGASEAREKALSVIKGVGL